MKTYTAEQAAEILQVNPATVRGWLRSGRLGGSRTPAGWRIEECDLRDFLNAFRPSQTELTEIAG